MVKPLRKRNCNNLTMIASMRRPVSRLCFEASDGERPVSLLFLTVSLCPLWVYGRAGDCSIHTYSSRIIICKPFLWVKVSFLGKWYGPWWMWYQDRFWWTSSYPRSVSFLAWIIAQYFAFADDTELISPTVSWHMGAMVILPGQEMSSWKKLLVQHIGIKKLNHPIDVI